MGKIFDYLNDDDKLKQKFFNKRINASAEGLEFELTAKQFMALMLAANVKSSDLCLRGYHLSRFHDAGDYSIGNCYFMPHWLNFATKAISSRARSASRRNISKASAALRSDPEALLRQQLGLAAYTKRRRKAAAKARKQFEAFAHKSYLGHRNSQYGTFWITNGKSNKKWSDNLGELPKGYHRGRVT